MMLLALLASALLVPPDPIIGRASVIDGDTIEIRGQRIRLWGVDAPEGRQTCQRGGRKYRCGQEAARYLADWIRDRNVSCEVRGRPDRYRRTVAVCYRITQVPIHGEEGIRTEFSDLAGDMVFQGWALDYPRYSDHEYDTLQREAQSARRGLWAGEFQRPWEWRGKR